MTKTILGLLAGLVFPITASSAAVLITTGTDADGKAFVTIPSTTFVVNVLNATGFSFLGVDVAFAWPSAGTPPLITLNGSGLSFTDSALPGQTFSLDQWAGHMTSGTGGGYSARDSLLVESVDPSTNLPIGSIITLQGGTLTVDNANPSFPVFPSGSYDLVVVGVNPSSLIISSVGTAVVPEPSTLVLLGLGTVGFCVCRRGAVVAVVAALTGVATIQAQEADTAIAPAKVDVEEVAVSALRHDIGGNPRSPIDVGGGMAFPGRGPQFSGASVMLLVRVPDGYRFLIGRPSAHGDGSALVSFVDSTGKDLLATPEGAPVSPFPTQQTACLASADRTQALISVSGIRAPRKGATSVSGVVTIPVVKGDLKIVKVTVNFGQGGTVRDDSGQVLCNFQPAKPRSMPPPIGGQEDRNAFQRATGGSQAGLAFSSVSPQAVRARILDTGGQEIASIDSIGDGLSWTFPARSQTGFLEIAYTEKGQAAETMKVPFAADLGLMPE